MMSVLLSAAFALRPSGVASRGITGRPPLCSSPAARLLAGAAAHRSVVVQAKQRARPACASAAGSGESWSADAVRSRFIRYFEQQRGHTPVPSSAVVPHDDPTLLFTNAGMNQFKPLFVGQAEPGSALASLRRATNSQKCIRAGGKHNDLEDVGMDTYHHTFFEMLGSWSFGDYFKAEAIAWAWELLTVEYGLPPSRMYATYFGGDEALGLPPDEEARRLWLTVLPPERVLPGAAADNFWEMGDTGPCGPCSEIHYDRIGGRDAAPLVNQDDPDVLEVWNLVFMQFDRERGGVLRPLPAQHVDTGMGFERLVSILQGARSNYDTDVFAPLFGRIEQLTGAAPYGGVLGACEAGRRDTAYRVVADHVRTLSVALADGALPSNEGRGYVLRRVLRRAVRYARQVLGAREGVLAALVPTVVASLGGAFPELAARQAAIQEVLAEEEAAFTSTLARGIKELNARAEAVRAAGGSQIDGETAFFLYDTMGFPLDLTELMAREAGLGVDAEGFARQMAEQKARSSAAAAAARGGGAGLVLGAEQTARLAEDGTPHTDDADKYVWAEPGVPSTLRAVLGRTGFVEAAAGGEPLGLVLDRTAFYAEAGGQACDVGSLLLGRGEDGEAEAEFVVSGVQSYGGFILHTGEVTRGTLRVGAPLRCAVDYGRRRKVAPNHTLTHLLNLALLRVLGDGVAQKGSDVDEHRLRFDFSHGKAMSAAQLDEVETLVREAVADALPVHSKVVPLAETTAIASLRSVFGERYPGKVRVVSVGPTVDEWLAHPADEREGRLSVELCGGTHLRNTAEAGEFVLAEEMAVAKGVRRVIGLTGEAAAEARAEGEQLAARLAALAAAGGEGGPPEQLEATRVALAELRADLDAATASAGLKAGLRADIGERSARVGKALKQALAAELDRASASAVEEAAAAAAAGDRFTVLRLVPGMDKAAQPLAQKVVKQTGLPVLVLAPDAEGGRVMACAAVPEGVAAEGALQANAWLASALSELGGKGGGRSTFAQGAGADAVKVGKAAEAAGEFARVALLK